MKKLLIVTAFIFTILLLVACDGLPFTSKDECQAHIWSEYKSNDRVHWREYMCGCPWPEIVEEHIDENEDYICDVCGYGLPYAEATWFGSGFDHYMAYKGYNGAIVIDVVWSQGAHTDAEDDGICDICSHNMPCIHTDEDKNKTCDFCEIEMPERQQVWFGNADVHWVGYKSNDESVDAPSVMYYEGGHVDKNGNNVCDMCKRNINCEHIDEDNDNICDTCGHDLNLTTVWLYDEFWHYMTYDDSYEGAIDIFWNSGRHIFIKDETQCSICSYVCQHTDEDNNNACDTCEDNLVE